ncbi:MAG: YciI family protein [Vicinamibacteria bacterium]
MRTVLTLLILSAAVSLSAQDAKPAAPPPPGYDAALAERLGADEYGMKRCVLVLLNTGPKTDVTPAEQKKAFTGHMANIGRLAKENKLLVAGPLAKNEKHLEGIFIFNVATVKEAEALLASDPAVAAGLLAFEAYGWYSTAALQEVLPIHYRIEKPGH